MPLILSDHHTTTEAKPSTGKIFIDLDYDEIINGIYFQPPWVLAHTGIMFPGPIEKREKKHVEIKVSNSTSLILYITTYRLYACETLL